MIHGLISFFSVGYGKCRVSIYALSVFIHYLSCAYKIPNLSPGLMFHGAYIRKGVWVSLKGFYIRGGSYLGFYGLVASALIHFQNAPFS